MQSLLMNTKVCQQIRYCENIIKVAQLTKFLIHSTKHTPKIQLGHTEKNINSYYAESSKELKQL